MATAAQTLVVVEILNEFDTRIELQPLVDSDDVSVRLSTLQMQFVALSVHENATTATTARDVDLAVQAIDRKDEPTGCSGR